MLCHLQNQTPLTFELYMVHVLWVSTAVTIFDLLVKVQLSMICIAINILKCTPFILAYVMIFIMILSVALKLALVDVVSLRLYSSLTFSIHVSGSTLMV